MKPLSLPTFIIATIAVNALSCTLLFFLLVLEASFTGYISGFGAPGGRRAKS